MCNCQTWPCIAADLGRIETVQCGGVAECLKRKLCGSPLLGSNDDSWTRSYD